MEKKDKSANQLDVCTVSPVLPCSTFLPRSRQITFLLAHTSLPESQALRITQGKPPWELTEWAADPGTLTPTAPTPSEKGVCCCCGALMPGTAPAAPLGPPGTAPASRADAADGAAAAWLVGREEMGAAEEPGTAEGGPPAAAGRPLLTGGPQEWSTNSVLMSGLGRGCLHS